MRNEMEAFTDQVSSNFQPIFQQLLPQLNTLDNTPTTNVGERKPVGPLKPRDLVDNALNVVRAQAQPVLQAQYSSLTTSNLALSNQLQQRHQDLMERLKHLHVKREVVGTVLNQINALSAGEDGELEVLVENMRKHEYAKVLY